MAGGGMAGPGSISAQASQSAMGAAPVAPHQTMTVPAPGTLPDIVSNGPWGIPGTGNPAIDSALKNRSVASVRPDGFTIKKTIATPDFWYLRDMPSGNWELSFAVDLPSQRELMSRGGPAMLGLGFFTTDYRDSYRFISPSPDASSSRTFRVDVSRLDGHVMVHIDGKRQGGFGVKDSKAMRFGCWFGGAVEASVHSISIQLPKTAENPIAARTEPAQHATESAQKQVGTVAKPDAAGSAESAIPKKRTWTDASGKHQVVAEYIRLIGDRLTLRKEDGKEVSVPLKTLSTEDQAIAKTLSKSDS